MPFVAVHVGPPALRVALAGGMEPLVLATPYAGLPCCTVPFDILCSRRTIGDCRRMRGHLLLGVAMLVGASLASACGSDGGGTALPSRCYNKPCSGPDSGACPSGNVCTGIGGCCEGSGCSAPIDFVCCPASGC